jgi:hypothetical protein
MRFSSPVLKLLGVKRASGLTENDRIQIQTTLTVVAKEQTLYLQI